MRYTLPFIGIILILQVVGAAYGDIPRSINYQGRLTESGQSVADGDYSLTFSLYSTSGGGSVLWTELQVVHVTDGLFRVWLGAMNPIPAAIFGQPDLWLGIQLEANPEMLPRQRIVSTAFAYHALAADTAAYAHVAPVASAGGWTDDGAVVRLTENTDRVGIGNTSPAVQLHVGASASSLQRAQIEGPTVIRTNLSGRAKVLTLMNLNGNSEPGSSLYFQAINSSSVNVTAGRIDGYLTDQTPLSEKGALVFMAGPSLSEAMRIDYQGNVGIAAATPQEKLHVEGKVYVATMDATVSGEPVYWYNNRLCRYTSSAKFKDDIRPLETDFNKILQVQPRSFVDRSSGLRGIGYIAEEFEALGLRDLVTYRDGEPDGLRYELVSLYLLEVIKAQAARIERLEETVESLK